MGASGAGDALRLAASWALRLSLGAADDPRLPAPDWALVREVALAERLLPLAWTRGGAIVRAKAGGELAAWRAAALGAVVAAERQVALTTELVRVCEASGAAPIVLRGIPLAQLAFGAPNLRPTADVDLFVDAQAWDALDARLVAEGWTRSYGAPPAETTYRRERGGQSQVLELHFALSDGALVRHLALPAPSARALRVNDVTVAAHADALLPAYLALHAAKHGRPPLLWFVELGAYWQSLTREQRREAFRAAAAHRVAGHLRWALTMASACERAADGDTLALRQLGFQGARRTDEHHVLRLVALSATVLDAARVLLAWAVPLDARRSPARLARLLTDRAKKALGVKTRGATTPEYRVPDASPGGAALPVSSVAEVARTVMSEGGSLWIRATGESMRPAIAPGTLVHLMPPDTTPISAGHVVLARLPGGRSVLHRVRRADRGRLTLQGDNALRADPLVSRDDVIAVATEMSVDGQVIPLSTRRRGALLRLRRRAATLVRRHSPPQPRTVR